MCQTRTLCISKIFNLSFKWYAQPVVGERQRTFELLRKQNQIRSVSYQFSQNIFPCVIKVNREYMKKIISCPNKTTRLVIKSQEVKIFLQKSRSSNKAKAWSREISYTEDNTLSEVKICIYNEYIKRYNGIINDVIVKTFVDVVWYGSDGTRCVRVRSLFYRRI